MGQGADLWPGGPPGAGGVYRLAGAFQARTRATRLRRFLELAEPRPETRVLDVGITNDTARASNFLEAGYPYPGQITAVSADPRVDLFARAHPDVEVVLADGRALPFADRSFDVAFSNAVVEHVGTRADQARFVAELCRVADRVFCSTPNPAFPIEVHSLLPFVHWLPDGPRRAAFRRTGRGYWAEPDHLRLVSARELRAMFAPSFAVAEPLGPPLGLRALAPVTTVWAVRQA